MGVLRIANKRTAKKNHQRPDEIVFVKKAAKGGDLVDTGRARTGDRMGVSLRSQRLLNRLHDHDSTI